MDDDPVLQGFLRGIASLRSAIEEIWLFGSRCRDDWRPDSDYDLLIVLPRHDPAVIAACYDAVMETLLATGRLVSLKIFPRAEFDRLRAIPTPFLANVLKEGHPLGFDHLSPDRGLPRKSGPETGGR
ncbi:MAG: nucleotidyltransferase domain-containing protein [Candidatus Riflebacteria bacterium]|nr:nucleotidyltransferase domain-containing protein [Candidatus Riflebacteria bacterium]